MAISFLADDYVTVYRSPNPGSYSVYSPGIVITPRGRIIATMDCWNWQLTDEDRQSNDHWFRESDERWALGRVFASDDGGKTFTQKTTFPFMHARPFLAGGKLYVIGQQHDLMIQCSEDDGETWSEPVFLTSGQDWQQAPSNVHYANGCVYLVMERIIESPDMKAGWPVCAFAPVLMRARVEDDLLQRGNWTFSDEVCFTDVVDKDQLEYIGIPFYDIPHKDGREVAPNRWCFDMGWLETNVIQILDKNNYLYDEAEKTFHLISRAHTGRTNFAAMMKVVEQPDGTMLTQCERVPSGKKLLYIPLPGGQMKFHILYDQITKLYWLISSQATDSFTRAELLEDDRYNLPDNERQRLQLHFSKNCIDWCFAGLVAKGKTHRQARNYASMAIDGEDLCVLCRSGDEQAKSAHDGNLITFHRIKNFRDLVY